MNSHRLSRILGLMLSTLMLLGTAHAQEIRQPLPNGSSNAALHYQRAILFLDNIDPELRKLLDEPLWKLVTPDMTSDQQNKISQLLFQGRHALRAGMIGTQQNTADFGTDLRAYGSAILLPHVESLGQLAKLIALYGMQQQGNEQWADAAETYLSVVRMGRHLTEQPTLGESAKGIRILETGYYSLVTWATHCTDHKLTAAARLSLLAANSESVSPLNAINTEAAIVDLRITQLQAAYPNGNWPEILLATITDEAETDDVTNWQEFAKSQAIKHGVPDSVFTSAEEFDKFADHMREVNRQYYARTLAALVLPPQQAILAGEKVHTEFADQLLRIGNAETLSPGQIAAFYATHEAAFRLLNVALAVCAQREGELFPADLTKVAATFGGKLPINPIDGKAAQYQVNSDRKGFRISFPAIKIGEIEVPQIAFDYNFAPKTKKTNR